MKISELFKACKRDAELVEWKGEDLEIKGISPVERGTARTLTFVSDVPQLKALGRKKPAVVTTRELAAKLPASLPAVIISTNVRLAQAVIRSRYADYDPRDMGWEQVHPSAVIHERAKLAPDVVVGPRAVIGPGVVVERGTVILAGVIIERDARIGADCVLHSNVVIGWGCELGERVIVHAGTIIGAEGYGYAADADNKHHRVPQTGRVVIESDVRFGANCCVDRATFDETRVGAGTKLDNLCHIAHNVKVGRDCLLTAGCIIAGSTVLGDRVVASGQTGILDHLKVASDVVLLHRAGVVDDVEKPGAYAGLPLQPLQQYLKNQAVFRKLFELRKELKKK